jgi:DNA-binding transcriptional LysR family regulator
VSDVEHLLRGTLTIGVSWDSQALDFPTRLMEFHEQHPQILVNLVQGASGVTIERVANGTLDLAFVYLGTTAPDFVQTETFGRGSMVLACSSRHRLAAAGEVTLEDLADEEFVNAPRDLLSHAVDAAFEARGLVRSNRIAVHALETQLDLVAAGLGVAIVPDPRNGGPMARFRYPALEDSPTKSPPVTFIPLAGTPLQWAFVSVLPARSRPTPAARAFLEMLQGDSLETEVGPRWPDDTLDPDWAGDAPRPCGNGLKGPTQAKLG